MVFRILSNAVVAGAIAIAVTSTPSFAAKRTPIYENGVENYGYGQATPATNQSGYAWGEPRYRGGPKSPY